jgi:hypothetical protein
MEKSPQDEKFEGTMSPPASSETEKSPEVKKILFKTDIRYDHARR